MECERGMTSDKGGKDVLQDKECEYESVSKKGGGVRMRRERGPLSPPAARAQLTRDELSVRDIQGGAKGVERARVETTIRKGCI